MTFGISVVIPTWNGLELLRENLPSVLAATRRYRETSGGETEIVVVDDGSNDETVAVIPSEFPEVRLIEKPRNEGFAKTCNAGFRACRHRLAALLNNDVRIHEDYLVRQAEHFDDPDVFAVTAKVFEWDPPLFATGGKYGYFRRGFWGVYFNYDVEAPVASGWIDERRLLSFYAVGGFATYHLGKLREAGGFLELLSPFHWEDIDLSYRGWKRGWTIRYEPRSVAHHRISATIDAHYEKRAVDAVALRNRLLFHWINLHSTAFVLRHGLWLTALLLTRVLVLDFQFYRALFDALRRLPEALRLRALEKRAARRSDRQVERILADFYDSAPIRVYTGRRQVEEEHPGV